MENPKSWIENDFPGIYVRNVALGADTVDLSFMGNMYEKVESFRQIVQADFQLQKGFNLVCYSQGGLICRAFIELFNYPPVFNFITWSTPHAGEYGIPVLHNHLLAKVVTMLINRDPAAWERNVTIPDYWKDPFHPEYHAKFLTQVNNEAERVQSYKDNLKSLNSFTMEFSNIDETIIPRESGIFQFYFPNQRKEVVPLKESQTYVEDWIGLRSLDEAGKLHLCETHCYHVDYPQDKCKKWYDLFTKDELNNTLS